MLPESPSIRRLLCYFALTYIVSLAASCGGRNDSAAQRPASDSTITAATDTTLSLTGVWVNKVYLDILLASGSPRKAINAAPQPCIEFRRDTAHIALSFHEGADQPLTLRDGKYFLGDSGEIVHISPEEIRIGHQTFVKFKHPNLEKYDYNIVEESLFAGNYQSGNGANIRFAGDGRVYGLDTIRYFTANVDYNGPGLDVDQVWMGSDSDIYKSPVYAFKFIRDTLFLYKLKCLEGYDSTNHSCGVVDYGQQIWKLIRKR